eukprot:SAG31_NODE_1401_length_8497_cov_4.386640_5_plen_73_part_00
MSLQQHVFSFVERWYCKTLWGPDFLTSNQHACALAWKSAFGWRCREAQATTEDKTIRAELRTKRTNITKVTH